MLGVCLSAFSFILFASVFGMPISGTHTVIGALIGAGLAGFPADSLNWAKFFMTVASWFISPILSSIIAGLLFLLICSVTLGGHVKSFAAQLHCFVLIAAVAVTFSAYMVTSLVIGDTHYQYLYAILLPVCFLIGVFFARLTLTFAANRAPTKQLTFSQWIVSIFGVFSFSTIIDNGNGHGLCKSVCCETYLQSSIFINHVMRFGYQILLVQAACLVCLAHGSNDVANSIAPLLIELIVTGKNTSLAYWLGGIGIAVGLVTLGYKVMETVGKKVIKLDFYKGFSC